MPTRKISDLPIPCSDPEHDPPKMMCYEPGVYEHECPSCKRVIQFIVNGAWL